jgi:hypothetical protein
MKAVQITTAATLIAAASHGRKFLHIQNVSDTDIYLCYDGGEGAAGVNLTTANGLKLTTGEAIMLNNDGQKDVFHNNVYGIHGGAGNKEVRVQGES